MCVGFLSRGVVQQQRTTVPFVRRSEQQPRPSPSVRPSVRSSTRRLLAARVLIALASQSLHRRLRRPFGPVVGVAAPTVPTAAMSSVRVAVRIRPFNSRSVNRLCQRKRRAPNGAHACRVRQGDDQLADRTARHWRRF